MRGILYRESDRKKRDLRLRIRELAQRYNSLPGRDKVRLEYIEEPEDGDEGEKRWFVMPSSWDYVTGRREIETDKNRNGNGREIWKQKLKQDRKERDSTHDGR